MTKYIFLWLVILSGLQATELGDIVLEPLPGWVNLQHFRYHQPLDIRLLAEKENLTLREAVEVQNHYYDLLDDRQNGAAAEEKFRKALDRVKHGEAKYENIWRTENIAKARFIVVFDLDDTLFDQYYEIGHKGPEYWDLKLDSARYNLIKFTPYWQKAIARVKELGGAVVFFTAKEDRASQMILGKWMFDDDEHISAAVDGFLTKNHLTLVPGQQNRPGRAFPMKDLMIVDPSLQRAILVDDSPSKTYQPLNVRFLHKYNPDIHLKDDTCPELKALYENLLKEVIAEIEDTLSYMDSHQGVTFVEAYRPYCLMGRVTLNSLVEMGIPKAKALRLIRETPELIEDRF